MKKLLLWIVAALAVPFVTGLCFPVLQDWSWFSAALLYMLALVVGFGTYLVVKLKGRPWGVALAIVLILVVLVPLAAVGTCGASWGGDILRSLFIK